MVCIFIYVRGVNEGQNIRNTLVTIFPLHLRSDEHETLYENVYVLGKLSARSKTI